MWSNGWGVMETPTKCGYHCSSILKLSGESFGDSSLAHARICVCVDLDHRSFKRRSEYSQLFISSPTVVLLSCPHQPQPCQVLPDRTFWGCGRLSSGPFLSFFKKISQPFCDRQGLFLTCSEWYSCVSWIVDLSSLAYQTQRFPVRSF